MPCQKIISTLIIFVIVNASAYEAPRHMLSGQYGFLTMGLRASCYAIDLSSDTLSCNPAFIAKEKQKRFNANLQLGNNVSYLQEATDLSKGQATEQSIQTMFTRHENNELQTQIELGHIQENFGWALAPAQVNYSTTFHNQALPKISLYASLEESAKIQFGSYLSDDWSFGIQLRYVHRRFVASQFYLTDALVPGGSSLFEPQQQHLVFIEPGVMYAPKESDLNPEFTMMVANSGYANKNYDEVPLEPEFHVTSSITPELKYGGRFSLAVDARVNKSIRTGSQPFTFGGYYEYGILRLFGSIARDENGIGFGIYNTWWNIGVANRNETYLNAINESFELNKTYLFLGMEL